MCVAYQRVTITRPNMDALVKIDDVLIGHAKHPHETAWPMVSGFEP